MNDITEHACNLLYFYVYELFKLFIFCIHILNKYLNSTRNW